MCCTAHCVLLYVHIILVINGYQGINVIVWVTFCTAVSNIKTAISATINCALSLREKWFCKKAIYALHFTKGSTEVLKKSSYRQNPHRDGHVLILPIAKLYCLYYNYFKKWNSLSKPHQ
jgi:hypothetical protein